MTTIKNVLKSKGNKIFSISSDESVFDAIKLMSENKVSSLLILDNEKLLGIITERDYAWKIILQGKSSKNTKVKEIMTTDILYAEPSQTIEECMALMTEKRIRHLPVLENNKLLGLVSIGDLVKAIIEEQKFVIKQLEHYLHN
jgi:CBS domain-containing protein